MRSSLLAVVLALGLGLALGAAGCTPDLCARNSDCATGLVCTAAGLCAKPPVDAGENTTDGATGSVDAAAADAAVDGQPVIEGQVR
jgi:hypothetical protein